jgi:hypothetical protein
VIVDVVGPLQPEKKWKRIGKYRELAMRMNVCVSNVFATRAANSYQAYCVLINLPMTSTTNSTVV